MAGAHKHPNYMAIFWWLATTVTGGTICQVHLLDRVGPGSSSWTARPAT